MWYLYEIDHSLYELIYDWEPPTLFMFPFMDHLCWFRISRCANVNSNAGAVLYFWKEFVFLSIWEGGKTHTHRNKQTNVDTFAYAKLNTRILCKENRSQKLNNGQWSDTGLSFSMSGISIVFARCLHDVTMIDINPDDIKKRVLKVQFRSWPLYQFTQWLLAPKNYSVWYI